jgi:uncharacterized lipoprotein NlpE involved in copper resistance
MKTKYIAIIAAIATITLSGCKQESEVAAYNVSQAAHNFEVVRRVVFYNGITGEYILTIEGLLSVTPENDRLSVIVKTGPKQYKKHYLGVSDNVTWFCEQLDSVPADPFHYRVIFRPTTIIPDIEVQTR